MKHTRVPLTYETEYSGTNWLLAVVDFGVQPDDKRVRGYITSDHVHASELVYGDPEADMKLWCASPKILALLMDITRIATWIKDNQNNPRAWQAQQDLGDLLGEATAVIAELAVI